MSNKRYILHLSTNWCGEDQDYGVIIKEDQDIHDFYDLFDLAAYDNFNSFGGFEAILEDLFPDAEEYTEEMNEEASEIEYEYYGWNVKEYEGPEDEFFEDYEIFLDTTQQ